MEMKMPLKEIPNLTDSQKILASIIENQMSLNTVINDLQEIQSKHHRILIEGNGEIPLVEKVRGHEKFLQEIRYWTKFIYGALILQTVAFGAGLIIAVVRFLPILEKLAANP